MKVRTLTGVMIAEIPLMLLCVVLPASKGYVGTLLVLWLALFALTTHVLKRKIDRYEP